MQYQNLLSSFKQSSSTGRVCDVEGVIPGWTGRVISSIHNEGVGLASLDHQLRDESVVDVPCNTPSCSTCT